METEAPQYRDSRTKNMSARLPMDHPPGGCRALQHHSNFSNLARGSTFIITFLLHHGNRVLWRAALEEAGLSPGAGARPGTEIRSCGGSRKSPGTRPPSPRLLSRIPPPSRNASPGCLPQGLPPGGRALLGTLPWGRNRSPQLLL